MKDTLTIRLAASQRRAVHRLAVALGQTDSEFVRTLIERGLAAESVGARLSHLAGALKTSAGRRKAAADRDAWTRSIRGRNWRG